MPTSPASLTTKPTASIHTALCLTLARDRAQELSETHSNLFTLRARPPDGPQLIPNHLTMKGRVNLSHSLKINSGISSLLHRALSSPPQKLHAKFIHYATPGIAKLFSVIALNLLYYVALRQVKFPRISCNLAAPSEDVILFLKNLRNRVSSGHRASPASV